MAGVIAFGVMLAGREWLRSFGRVRWPLPLDDRKKGWPLPLDDRKKGFPLDDNKKKADAPSR
ncbi:MAG: hypothetical protein WAO23_07185 [Dethiobacteria bacterium]